MARHLGMFTSVGALVAASLLVAAPASAVAPANDDFDAAAPLSAGGSSTVDNTEATLEAEEPRPSCNTMVSGSVWYSFTPAANDRFQVDTLDTIGVDTVLAIYEGNTLGGLWEVACNDDSNATASKVVTQLSGGTTYWIQVSNYEWAAAGSITTRITAGAPLPTEPPNNDRMESGRLLQPGSQIEDDNTYATTDADDSRYGPPVGCNGEASLWYVAWARDFPEGLLLDTSGTSFDSELLVVEVGQDFVRGWCARGGGAGDDARLQIPTPTGDDYHLYYVRVASQDGATGMLQLSAQNAAVPDAPRAVHAVGGDRSARVTWTPGSPNGSPITGYTITRHPGGVTKPVAGNATSVTVTGLTNGARYTFTVKATSAIGSSPASAASNAVTPAGVPKRMRSPNVAVRGSRAIVKWPAANPNGSSITRYKVDISTGKDKALPASARKTVFENLKPGSYKVRITARNAIGTGPYSTWTRFRIR